MVESTGKLARFVGLDAYKQAGGTTRADLFEERIYLEQPALLHQLADEKLTGIRKELGDEGWSWVEVNPERADDFIHRCGRIKPHLIGVPKDLVELKSELDEELEFVEHAYLEVESDGSLEKRQAILDRLDGVERTLTEYVGFDATQKALAGCYVSIGHDGSLFLDKGLVKPEHRKLLGKLLGREDDTPVKVKPKDALPEKLRRDLASDRLQVAKVEIARHPAIARDVLVFRVASELLGGKRPSDGPDIQFYQTKSGRDREPSLAARELAALEKELPTGWLKGKTEAARFEVFCSIPEEAKSQLLAYCVAMTLQPALGRTESGEITAYDAALLKTAGQVSAYWRPSKANFLSRITREQLLAVGSEVLGEPWAVAHHGDKKAALVDQLDRAFSNPDKSGRTPDQIDKLKRWLPKGMAFDLGTQSKPAKSKKARKAA
jgi:ParB family chromosome partitioning protein